MVAGLGGQTHVWRGTLLVSILLSGHVNGLTDMAIGAYFYWHYRAMRGRGENERLWWTLSTLFFLGGLAQVLGSGTPFLPRPAAIVMMVAAVVVRVVRAGFAGWNFPNLRRDLKAESAVEFTRAELQQMVDELREAQAHVEQAHIETNNDAIKDAHERIISTLSILERLDSGLERLAVQ